MKEKYKKILKNKNIKIILLIILWLFILQQSYAIYVDMYNFRQLEKAKVILNEIPKDAKRSNIVCEQSR